MSEQAIPQGMTLRAANLDDIPAILEFLRINDLAEYGEAEDRTPEDAARWFRQAKGIWLVETAQPQLVGYLELQIEGHGVLFGDGYVHPDYNGQGIGTFLVKLLETEAAKYVDEEPEGAQVILQSGVNGRNDAASSLFTNLGFHLERRFHRMGIDMTEPPPAPEWPKGITITTTKRGEERAVFEAVMASFQDHWGHTPREYDKWYERRIDSRHYEPDHWYLALDGDQIAGFSLCSTESIGGWVDTLGVLRPWRRQGLALALLRYSFGQFWERGITRVLLGVDATNLTGANRVYERGGMSMVQQYRVYAKILRPGEDLRTTEISA